MKSYFNNVFSREYLISNDEIVRWWSKGWGLFNIIALIYTILHLAIIVLVFENGWIFFLLPIIFGVFILINILYSIGLLFEIVALRLFKSTINFDRVSPVIKKWEFVLFTIIILMLSLLDILNQ